MRILVVRVGAMGDVLHALPAVTALRERWPECRIGWAIEPAWRSLIEGVVDRVHLVPTRRWKQRLFHPSTASEIAALGREMRAERYDVCIDLQGSIRSAFIGWMAGAGRFVGSAAPREWPARWLYGERVPVRAAHVIDQGCELLGGALDLELAPARVKLGENPVPGVEGERFCFLVPTAGWGAKQWPVERYRDLAASLRRQGLRVLVNAATADDRVAREIAAGGAAEVFPCGLEELATVVARAAVVIGGDTGPVHLAAALGVPVVALFGPTDPARTGPQGFPGSRVVVLRDASSRVDHRRHPEAETGLARVPVEQVLEAVRSLGVMQGRNGWRME